MSYFALNFIYQTNPTVSFSNRLIRREQYIKIIIVYIEYIHDCQNLQDIQIFF